MNNNIIFLLLYAFRHPNLVSILLNQAFPVSDWRIGLFYDAVSAESDFMYPSLANAQDSAVSAGFRA